MSTNFNFEVSEGTASWTGALGVRNFSNFDNISGLPGREVAIILIFLVVLFTITWKGGDELLLCSQTPSSGDSQLCSLHPVTTARTEVNVFVRKNSFQEISYKYITQI